MFKPPQRKRSSAKETIIRKLTSRKFWAAIAEFVVALMIFLKKDASYAQEIGALIMLAVTPWVYIFAEGWADTWGAANHQEEQPETKPPEGEG